MEISPKSAYDREGLRKYLTRNEGRKFIEKAVELPKTRALFSLTLYYTGCRISEALKLRQSDLDCETKTILIRSLKKRGRNEFRRIPIPEFLCMELAILPASENGLRIWEFSRTTGWRIIRALMKAAKISGMHATCKGLRHGFGVRSVMEQVPLYRIQNWMGHSDSSTTAIYLDVQDEEERALIARTWK